VYVWIKDGQAELRDASSLWGKTTSEVEDALKAELGDDKIEIAQCGPAGEKLSRLASVINMANRAAGRTGMGAVMGSKNLKAVVVRGSSKRLPTAEAKAINELAKAGAGGLEANGDVNGLKLHGSDGLIDRLPDMVDPLDRALRDLGLTEPVQRYLENLLRVRRGFGRRLGFWDHGFLGKFTHVRTYARPIAPAGGPE
jgi:hypothetical protein